MPDCVHLDFVATVEVSRLFDQDVGEDVARTRLPDRFMADITVSCAQCGEQFVFLGFGVGMSPRQPRVSLDGTEARVPIRHESAPPGWGEDGAGFGVSVDVMPGRKAN